MGADFIGIAVPITRTRQEALAKLEELSLDEVVSRIGENSGFGFDIASGGYDLHYDDDTHKPVLDKDAIMNACRKYLNDTYDVAEGKVRTAGWTRIGDCQFVLAGGVSWGDAPEFYDELEIAYSLGVTYDDAKTLKWVD